MPIILVDKFIALNTDNLCDVSIKEAVSVSLPENYKWEYNPHNPYAETLDKITYLVFTFTSGNELRVKFYPHKEGLQQAQAAFDAFIQQAGVNTNARG